MISAQRLRIGLFAGVFAVIAAMLLLTFDTLKREERLLADASQENLYWTAAQVEIELQRYISELGRFAVGAKGASAATVRRRFDILWSRTHLFDQGEVGARMTAFAPAKAAVRALKDLLGAAEARISTLADHDMATAVALLDEVSASRVAVRRAVTVLIQAEEDRARAIRLAVAENHRMTAFIAVGGLAMGVIFIGVLMLDIRNARREAAGAAETAAQAEANSRAKSRFLELMSHELRTPFNGLLGLIALARNGSIGGREAAYLDRAAESGRAFAETLDSALACFELDDGADAPKSSFAPIQALASVTAMLAPQAAQAGVAMRGPESGGAEMCFALGDALGFRRMTTRMIGSALRLPSIAAIEISLDIDAGAQDGLALQVMVAGVLSEPAPPDLLQDADWGLEVAQAMARRLGGGVCVQVAAPTRWECVAEIRFEAAKIAARRIWIDAASQTSLALLGAMAKRAGATVVGAAHEADVLLIEASGGRAPMADAQEARPTILIADEDDAAPSDALRLRRPIDPHNLKALLDKIFAHDRTRARA